MKIQLIFLFLIVNLSFSSNSLRAQEIDSEILKIGKIKIIHSKVLNQKRKLFIYKPQMEIFSEAPLPVLYMMDGENIGMVGTYGSPEKSSPSGITQGGYADNIVVTEHFAIKIPDNLDLKHAAPLLCAGITTYSPLVRENFKKGDKIGVIGIGGLGHMAIKLAVSKGAEVYAFTTTASKKEDILSFGAKEVIVVDSIEKLNPYRGKLDYMLSTVPYEYDVASYASCVKPYGNFTQVGVPINGLLSMNNFQMVANRVKYSASLIGGIPETQEVVEYCAQNNILPQIEIIKANQINDAWDKVVNKEARYRFVIDAATF